jgi:hypothetical protein
VLVISQDRSQLNLCLQAFLVAPIATATKPVSKPKYRLVCEAVSRRFQCRQEVYEKTAAVFCILEKCINNRNQVDSGTSAFLWGTLGTAAESGREK